jgi:hypothetical protein
MFSSRPLSPYNQEKYAAYSLLGIEGEFVVNAPPLLRHLLVPKSLGNFLVCRIRIDVDLSSFTTLEFVVILYFLVALDPCKNI